MTRVLYLVKLKNKWEDLIAIGVVLEKLVIIFSHCLAGKSHENVREFLNCGNPGYYL